MRVWLNPLLERRGARANQRIVRTRRAGWSLTSVCFGMRFAKWLASDHPVSAASDASLHLLTGGATPPLKEGNRPRWAAAALLATLILSASCIKRAAVNQDFGLPPRGPSKAVSRQSSFRPILQQQSGAFNPLTDDARVQELQARLKANAADPAARLELAGVFEGYRLYDDAIEQYTQSLRTSFGEQAALGLARCEQASGRVREVIPLLEGFVKERPSASVWNQLGLLYDSVGELSSGERAFRAALEDSAIDRVNAAADRLHNNLGYNLLLQKKSEAAEVEFRKALELNASSANTHNNLGIMLARRGELQAALEQFQFAADEATAHNNLAVVLLEAGQYEQSREELVKALALRRNFAPALANFKLVQEKIRSGAEGAHSK